MQVQYIVGGDFGSYSAYLVDGRLVVYLDIANKWRVGLLSDIPFKDESALFGPKLLQAIQDSMKDGKPRNGLHDDFL